MNFRQYQNRRSGKSAEVPGESGQSHERPFPRRHETDQAADFFVAGEGKGRIFKHVIKCSLEIF